MQIGVEILEGYTTVEAFDSYSKRTGGQLAVLDDGLSSIARMVRHYDTHGKY